MRKLLVSVTLAAALLILGSASAASPTTVKVLMHEPGCHSFFTGTKYVQALIVHHPVKVFDYDEDALLVSGPAHKRIAVGKSVLLTAPGVYRIKMVGQEKMDYTLKLTVR